MTGETKDIEFFVNDSVYVQVVSLALQEFSDLIPAKGRNVNVHQQEGTLTADIHVYGYYGDNLCVLARTVQEHVAAALQEMAAPQTLEVHVTVDDVVLKEQS